MSEANREHARRVWQGKTPEQRAAWVARIVAANTGKSKPRNTRWTGTPYAEMYRELRNRHQYSAQEADQIIKDHIAVVKRREKRG